MLSDFGLEPIDSNVIKAGDVFGRLTVLTVGQIKERRRGVALCVCECGAGPIAIRFDSLRKGVTVSCGCLHAERIKTHGQTKSAHYKRWWHMLDRCRNPESPAFADYGGRGITVCERWSDVANFIADLPPGYFPGAQIDRIDNDGHYEPGNIRWATPAENADNRRTKHALSFNGRTMSLTAWAKEIGISEATLRDRLYVSLWPIEKALTLAPLNADDVRRLGREARWASHSKKPRPSPRIIKLYPYKGEQLTMREMAARSGVPLRLLRKRIDERSWTIERATEQ